MRIPRNRAAAVGLLLAAGLLARPAVAQVITTGPDSAVVSAPAVSKDIRRTEKLFGMSVTRPKKAGLLALLPGGGQIYNHKYWKLPLVYGAIGGTIYGEYFYQMRYREYVEGYEIFTLPRSVRPANFRTLVGPNVAQARDSSVVRQNIIFYRQKRDVFIAYAALAYTMTILDAVVDAHLKDFDISDDLGLHWQPTLLWMPTAALTPGFSVTLSLNNTRSRRSNP